MSNPMVFLNYAIEDLRSAKRLYKALRQKGINVWFNKESLKPGQQSEPIVKRAIRESRYFLALVSSRSIQKVGYVNFEIYEALEQSKKYPPDVPYLLPVRLDDCSPSHERLREVQWVDLFKGWKNGVAQIVRVVAPRPETSADRVVSPILRTDGLYVAKTEGDVYRFYNLRFFANGEVVAVSSDWLPDQLAPYMTPTSRYMAVGKYTVRGTRINFSTRSEQGVVGYRGHLTPETLVLLKSSRITHYRDVYEYSFTRVAALSEETDVPQPNIARKGRHRKRCAPKRGH